MTLKPQESSDELNKLLFFIFQKVQNWCTCGVGTREPGNHDNGASDDWTLTAYMYSREIF